MRSRNEPPIATHRRVVIIGGGPAGATAATMLAREGIDVCLLERDAFPRYHIGESLVTSLIPLLQFMGASDKVAAHGFVKKPGAYFLLKQGLPPGYVDFAARGPFSHSYQVIRAEFDELLLAHSAAEGADVYENVDVREVELEDGRPIAVQYEHTTTGARGRLTFDFLLDASGLNGILATRYFEDRGYQEYFANVAVGSYYRNYAPFHAEQPGAFFSEAISDGRGWIWTIPLHDGTLSVGAVMHKSTFTRLHEQLGSHQAVLDDCIAGCPVVTRMLAGATRAIEARVWRDYSYCSSSFAGDNYRLLGDAAGFIDPLFSTGVHMAMLGGMSSAATVAAVLRDGIGAERAARFHDGFVRRAYIRFVLLVAGAYRQIHNQSEYVFFGGDKKSESYLANVPELDGDTFTLAFHHIQPILSGSVDVVEDQIPKEAVSEAMDLLAGIAVEEYGLESGSKISKLIGRSKHSEKVELDDLVGRNDPIDGLYVRMERGRLGLEAAVVRKR